MRRELLERNGEAGVLDQWELRAFGLSTKNLSAYGDAGMVTTSGLNLADHMRNLRNHGSPRRCHHEVVGWNCHAGCNPGCHSPRKAAACRNLESTAPETRGNLRSLLQQSGIDVER